MYQKLSSLPITILETLKIFLNNASTKSAIVSMVTSRLDYCNDFSVESMMISFGNLDAKGATLDLVWEDVMISMPIKVGTDKAVDAQYDRMMAGPSGRDYYNLGSYYHETGKDLKKALEFVNLAIADGAKFWMVRRKSMIQADLGDLII